MKYAVKTCYKCQVRLPANEMIKKTIEVKTGRSSISASTNFSKKSSTRWSSGRDYFRTKDVWLCSNCAAKVKSKTEESVSGAFLLIIVVGVLYYFFKK